MAEVQDWLTRPATQLNKHQATLRLQYYGEVVPSAWTTVEIRGRIVELEKAARSGSAGGLTLAGLSTKKKGDLQEMLRILGGGSDFTANTTRAMLMRMIRTRVKQASPPWGSDEMEIGKHAGKRYDQIEKEDTEYCRWVKEELQAGARTPNKAMGDREPHWELTRFLAYLERDRADERPQPVARKPRPSAPSVASSPASMGKETAARGKHEGSELEDDSKAEEERDRKFLVGALRSMVARMDEMEKKLTSKTLADSRGSPQEKDEVEKEDDDSWSLGGTLKSEGVTSNPSSPAGRAASS